MSDLRPASFKGVVFYVQDTSGEFGRRNVLHEYPFRDLPYSEDLGRAARGFSINGFLKTSAEADQFIADALESEGAGTLIHPWYGSAFVQLDGKAKVQWPAAAGGRISLDLVFIEAGENTEPNAADDTDALLEMAADSVLDDINSLFEGSWLDDIEGWIEAGMNAVNGVFETLESYLSPLDRAMALIDRITNAIQGFINNPLGLAKKIQSRIDALMNLGQFSGMSAVNGLMNGKVLSAFNPSKNNGSSWVKPKPSTSTPPSWTIPDSDLQPGELPPLPPALVDLVRRQLLVEVARQLPYQEFNSKQDVQEASNQLMQWLDNEIKNAPDELYLGLQNLQIATANAFAANQHRTRDIVTIATLGTLPALVIAYQQNGNIRAVDDLIARNNVRHPGFVPAGKVEVLLDGK